MATKVKICGVTTVEDATMAISEGADAIGLKFYFNSKRYLTISHAKQIFQKMPNEKTLVVGVFVNEDINKIMDLKDDIFDCNLNIMDIFRKYNFNIIINLVFY